MTKAMKMVAASRLKKSKQLVEFSRPYAKKVREMASGLASNVATKDNFNEKFPLLSGKGKQQKHLLVIVSSDRGLCGGLNSGAVKLAKQTINNLTLQGREVKIFCLGKKAYEQLKTNYDKQIIGTSFGIFKDIVKYESAEEVSAKLLELFNQDQFDVCQIIYSKFKSAISQEQTSQQLIPVPIKIEEVATQQVALNSPMNYEASEEEILNDLLPKNLTIQIYHSLLENSASEQGARMAAMEAATNNAAKMIKNLTLVYNRTRQANITRELIDIISGANVV